MREFPHCFLPTRTHHIQDGGCPQPRSQDVDNMAPALLNREEKKSSEALRFGSHSPTLTEAEIEHNGCSEDGEEEAKGDEKKR